MTLKSPIQSESKGLAPIQLKAPPFPQLKVHLARKLGGVYIPLMGRQPLAVTLAEWSVL